MKIIQNNDVFYEFEYLLEEQLERYVVDNADMGWTAQNIKS